MNVRVTALTDQEIVTASRSERKQDSRFRPALPLPESRTPGNHFPRTIPISIRT